jgi:hypothetical protein
MAQWNKNTQDYLNQERTLFEVNMLANKDGNVVDATHPLPVTLGSENITITGDVNIGTTVEVSSTPENPVHNHITEVGTSGLLSVPYLPVSVSNFPATQPVSGPLTDAQLRNTAVPVSGPLTDAQLRNTAVPVSGTFWQATQPVSGPLTDAQLRNTAVPVSGSVNIGSSSLFLLRCFF